MTTNPPKLPQVDQAQVPNAEKSFKWLIILLAIVAGCLLAFYFSNFHAGVGDKGDFGAFGDYFGGVLNPILGFATVSLLVWSLKYQMDELALSRQELALTRQELAETKEETALSRKAMEEQVTHLKKEAELSELTRLIAKTIENYEVSLSIKHTSEDFTYRIGSESISHPSHRMDYKTLLEEFYPSLPEEGKIQLAERTLLNTNKLKYLNRIRHLTVLISDLSLKYYSINKSTEFARVYLFDAYDFLHTINQIYPNEITLDRAGKISHILINSMEIMPKNITE